jgi:hypothetical protein
MKNLMYFLLFALVANIFISCTNAEKKASAVQEISYPTKLSERPIQELTFYWFSKNQFSLKASGQFNLPNEPEKMKGYFMRCYVNGKEFTEKRSNNSIPLWKDAYLVAKIPADSTVNITNKKEKCSLFYDIPMTDWD